MTSGPPEDIAVNGHDAFVSSLADGSITKLDLADGGKASEFVPKADDAYSSSWGLRVFRQNKWLLNLQNQPYDFEAEHAQAGRLTAFDLETGKKLRSWDLPAQAVGNSVDVDDSGNIYVGDIGPNARILKIGAGSSEVAVWATSEQWVDGGFGIGGMVVSGAGLYAAHDNALWYIAFGGAGEAAAPTRVAIEGDPTIFADGMAWVDGGLVYAENDVMVPGSHGAVYEIHFSDPTTAKRNTLRENLQDPSGIALAQVAGESVFLVNESQLGFAFGVDPGGPALPYKIKVLRR